MPPAIAHVPKTDPPRLSQQATHTAHRTPRPCPSHLFTARGWRKSSLPGDGQARLARRQLSLQAVELVLRDPQLIVEAGHRVPVIFRRLVVLLIPLVAKAIVPLGRVFAPGAQPLLSIA